MTDNNLYPYITCLMMSSVDGKTLGDTWGDDPKVKKLIEKYEEAHKKIGIESWICGRKTFEKDFTFNEPPIYREGTDVIGREDFIANQNADSYAIAVDKDGKLGWKNSDLHGEHVISILTESVPDSYLRHLQYIGSSYIFAGKNPDDLDLDLALRKLRSIFGIEKLMLEGGGHLNGSFLEKGLIDEFVHLLLPIIDGKEDTGTIFQIKNYLREETTTLLQLKELKQIEDDVIWINYQIVK